jgi:hypothetical protein
MTYPYSPPPGRFGNSPRLSFHNPGLSNVDFMIGKKFFLHDGMNAVFQQNSSIFLITRTLVMLTMFLRHGALGRSPRWEIRALFN